MAEYVPNLTQSKVRPSNDGQIKLWQEGAQKIVGFDFRASVEMFMDEHFGTSLPMSPDLCVFVLFVFCFFMATAGLVLRNAVIFLVWVVAAAVVSRVYRLRTR